MDSSLSVGFGPVKDSNGRMWVTVNVLLGTGSFAFAVPVDKGEEFVKQFGEGFRAALKDAKRQASGLVVAGKVPGERG